MVAEEEEDWVVAESVAMRVARVAIWVCVVVDIAAANASGSLGMYREITAEEKYISLLRGVKCGSEWSHRKILVGFEMAAE